MIVSTIESDELMPMSIRTKRNSMRTAPVYTMIWTNARNGAPSIAYIVARQSITTASMMAQCTARLTRIMATAAPPARMARIHQTR